MYRAYTASRRPQRGRPPARRPLLPGLRELHLQDQVVVAVTVQLLDRLERVLARVVGHEGEASGQAGGQVLGEVHALQPSDLPEQILQVALPDILGEVRDPERGLLRLVPALAFALAVGPALALAAERRRHVRRLRGVGISG